MVSTESSRRKTYSESIKQAKTEILAKPDLKDRDQITSIFRKVYKSYPLDTKGIENFIDQDNVKTICVRDSEGKIVGVGFLEIETGSNQYGSITGVAVLPCQRGKGYGKLINEDIIKLARKLNLNVIQSDPVLNFEGLSDKEQNSIAGGGNNPNLINLKITLKNKFLVTGFSPAWFQDISREIGSLGEQYTSVIRSSKLLNSAMTSDYNKQYYFGFENLEKYWKSSPKITPDYNLGGLHPDQVKYINNGRVQIASSTDIEDFKNSSFLPTYFLPCYTTDSKTIFIGIYYEKGLPTRTSDLPQENFCDLDMLELGKILDTEHLNLLKIMLDGIKENYQNQIIYSPSEIKLNNL